ncbi:MAG TPA: crossover junction endodeoxyribonuclease RuvC [Vicinamibacterales bacterium]|nr:crossover junction endodeoxyribonuclease RuvC [Vicinamibacterales bacterium]
MIVLGIDPGTAITGYGVVSTFPDSAAAKGAHGAPRQNEIARQGAARLVECGVIRTSPRAELASRLHDIFEGVAELIERHKPDALAVEDVFYARNVRTTVVLGHARGVVLLAGARAGVAIHEYAPALIKKTVVGRGAATKDQVQFMVARLLRLKSPPQPADAADGVACALTCVMSAATRRLQLRVAG